MSEQRFRVAVFGPGHGDQYLPGPGGLSLGSGHVAYVGRSISDALIVLAHARLELRRLRSFPGNRWVADTYQIYIDRNGSGERWEPLPEHEGR